METVLLLHSSASSGAQWRALADELGARYRVLAPDLYGCGSSAQWPGHAPFRLEHEAAAVRALLDGPAHVVGHSYGGAVALHLARTQSLRSLTLIEPVAFHLLKENDAHAFAEIDEVGRMVVAPLTSGDYMAGMERFFDYWSGPGAWAGLTEEKRASFALRLSKVALDFHATFGEPQRLADYRALNVPVLLIRGARSPLPTRRICELLANALREARLETIEGAGHMCPLTHRDAVNGLITEHLDTNRGQRKCSDPAWSVTSAPGERRSAPRSAGGWRTGRESATGSA